MPIPWYISHECSMYMLTWVLPSCLPSPSLRLYIRLPPIFLIH